MNPWQLFALFYLLGWTYTVGLGTPDIQRILKGEIKVHGLSLYRLAVGMFIASLVWPYVLYMQFSGEKFDSPLISPPIQPQMPVEPDGLEDVSPPTECKPCDRYWFPAIYGPGVGEPCTRCGQPVTKQESPLSPGALTRAQQPDARYLEEPCPEEPDIPLMWGEEESVAPSEPPPLTLETECPKCHKSAVHEMAWVCPGCGFVHS